MSDEMFALIFVHLSVIILMGLRPVCKAFRDLIDSQYFTYIHLRHSMTNRSNRIILCRSTDPDRRSVGLYCVDIDTLRCFVPKCPRGRNNSSTKLIGTCNGVVLLFDRVFVEITFWNPAIRTYIDVTLPCVSLPQSYFIDNYRPTLGFGYDHVNADYKVVMVVHPAGAGSNSKKNDEEVHIYSLKSNSWRRIGNFPSSVNCRGDSAVCVNGALYWKCLEKTVNSRTRHIIVAFDLATEEYRVVPTPVYDHPSWDVDIYIGSIEASLWVQCSLFHTDPEIVEDFVQMVDTWLLVPRNGEEDTWTKLISFNRPSEFYQPLAYSKSGNQLLLGSEEMFMWYDLVKEEVQEEFKIRGLPEEYVSEVFVESLVHLHGGAGDVENQLIQEKKVEDDESDRGLQLLSSMAMKILEGAV
ncbi:F-box protein CPR1-like [Apium graveolens]|uniref:F-box protein CPR1-like n=1 Tax=Apium graveolens TaxID=4045 RepID=UPI003D7B0DE3